MNSNLVAIHQPNFFPWLGYFAKMTQADLFVFLDDVQFPKTGGVWTNRVGLIVDGNQSWLTAPVDRSYRGTRLVSEMKFSNSNNWRTKVLRLIHQHYGKHPYYSETILILEPLIRNPSENIADYNIQNSLEVVRWLGVPEPRFVRSSDLGIGSVSTLRLCEIVEAVRGDGYLSGDGACGYQDDSLFQKRGIHLRRLNFTHPIYPQIGAPSFMAGLSIIDALMNCGKEGVKDLIARRQGT